MKCKYCGKELGNRLSEIGSHHRWCEKRPDRKLRKVGKCKVCGIEINSRRSYCGSCRPRHHTESTKIKLSEMRKKWIRENPDKHPWCKIEKFISKPCEKFKQFLREHGIKYVEEYKVLDDHNYYIDIAFPDKKIGIEINGNQHYQNDGNLKPYYQHRHDLIESFGWKIIEIQYIFVYRNKFLNNILNTVFKNWNCDERFYFDSKRKKKRLYRTKDDIFYRRTKKFEEIVNKRIELINNSNINFSKQGWVKQVSELVGMSHSHVSKFMRKFMPETYLICFKRKRVKCKS